MVKKESCWSMRRETLWVNFSTSFRMYLRKVSEDQRPMSMMVKVGTTSRYIAMASPERMEWVPMSSGWKPRRSSPNFLAVERSFLRTVEDFIVFSFLSSNIVLTVVLVLVPGYPRIRWTIAAHDRMGHSVESPERFMVTYSWRSSDFWNSKVGVMVSARERFCSE